MRQYREQAVWGENVWNSHIHFWRRTGSYDLVIATRKRAVGIYWRWKPVPLWRFIFDYIGVSWNRFPAGGRIDEIAVTLLFLCVSIGV